MKEEIKIQEVIDCFYKIISGEKEKKRDWKTFKSLFMTNANILPLKFIQNKCISVPKDVNTYIKGLENLLMTKNFFEYGLNYDIKVFNKIAHVYSQYEAKSSLDEEVLVKEGVCLVQLVKFNNDWKIISMVWQDK